MQDLSDQQRRVYDEMERCAAEGRPGPTLRELCQRFGWASTAAARDCLNALVHKGYLAPAEGRARGHQILRRQSTGRRVPLLGEVPAGAPFEAVEVVGDEVSVPEPMVSGGVSFALRVCGDSMVGAGILQGDIVFVRAQQVAELGEIVVARVGGDVTVKRLGRSGSAIALLPENNRYSAIPIDDDTEIVGVVVGLARGYDRRTGRH